MWNGSPEGMRPGANPVPLDEVRLSAKPTGLRWMGSLYTFEGVQPSIRTSEHLTRCGSAMTSTPPNWDHDRQRHQAAPFSQSRQHHSLPVSNCYSQSRKHGAGLQLSMGAWRRSRPTECDSTFRPIRAYAACNIRPRGTYASTEQESTCQDIASPIQRPRPNRDSLRDRQLHASISSDWPASGALTPSRWGNP